MAAKTEDTENRRRCCLGLPLFILNLCGMLLFFMIGTVYTAAVIRTIERRFDLRSSQTGLLFSCNEMTNTVVVLFIGFFGRRAHKPRLIAATILFSVVSFLMMALPHWLFSSSESLLKTTANNSSSTVVSTSDSPFCPKSAFNSTLRDTRPASTCDETAGSDWPIDSSDEGGLHSAYYIFVIAQLLGGIGSSGLITLGLTYIDENAPKSKTSMYIGIVTSMFAIGPLCAFALSAFTLRLPENLLSRSGNTERPTNMGIAVGNPLLSATSEKPEDSTFIGCWWLGYVICGFVLLLFSIPMWFYPKSYRNSVPHGHSSELSRSTEAKGLLGQIKEFPRSVLLLARNKVFLLNLGCYVCTPFVIMGVNSNIVRYVEVHFLQRAFVGSIIAALAAALPGAVGSFAGGLIMSKLQLNLAGAVRLMIISAASFSTGLLVILLLSCPQTSVAGRTDPTDNTVNVLNDCNRHCGCLADRKAFVPVCGSDNLTYFSACFAGCTRFANGTNLDCACLTTNTQLPGNHSTSQFDFSGTVKPGFCESKCELLIPFAVVLFLTFLLGYMSMVPVTMVNLRIVDGDERSFALAVCGFIVNISGFLAPLLFGRLVDSSCRMWQRTAAISSTSCDRNTSGDTGNCLLYDTAKIRQRIYGPVLGFKLVDLTFTILMFIFIRKMVFKSNADDEVQTNGKGDATANGDVEDSQLLNIQQNTVDVADETTTVTQ